MEYVIADGYYAVDKWRQTQTNENKATNRVCIGPITRRVEDEYRAKTTNKYYDSKNNYDAGDTAFDFIRIDTLANLNVKILRLA